MRNKLGAVWKKELSTGTTILSGSVTINGQTTRITLWPISDERKAENPKRPDYDIVEDTFVPQNRRESSPKDDFFPNE